MIYTRDTPRPMLRRHYADPELIPMLPMARKHASALHWDHACASPPTAAEWLRQWRLLPRHMRRYRKCPVRQWIFPSGAYAYRVWLNPRRLPK